MRTLLGSVWRRRSGVVLSTQMLLVISLLMMTQERSFAQAGCSNSYVWGNADSGSGPSNRGTLGVVTIPRGALYVNSSPFFIAQSVWIWSTSQPDTYAAEGGVFIGKGALNFRDY